MVNNNLIPFSISDGRVYRAEDYIGELDVDIPGTGRAFILIDDGGLAFFADELRQLADFIEAATQPP